MPTSSSASASHSPSQQVVAIIPARYASTRLPGKPLAMLAGKPMIQHVHERAASMKCLDRVMVATDDERIAEAVRNFGGEAVMTRADHPTGADRLGEAAQGLQCDIIVNIQGDEPFIQEVAVETALQPLLADAELLMSSIRVELDDEEALHDPNVVKVVTDLNDFALYFSRLPIPFDRSSDGEESSCRWSKHVGLYAYRRSFLLEFVKLSPTPLEQRERLEQLRVLEHGYRIKVPSCPVDTLGVDTPRDLQRARRILEQGGL